MHESLQTNDTVRFVVEKSAYLWVAVWRGTAERWRSAVKARSCWRSTAWDRRRQRKPTAAVRRRLREKRSRQRRCRSLTRTVGRRLPSAAAPTTVIPVPTRRNERRNPLRRLRMTSWWRHRRAKWLASRHVGGTRRARWRPAVAGRQGGRRWQVGRVAANQLTMSVTSSLPDTGQWRHETAALWRVL